MKDNIKKTIIISGIISLIICIAYGSLMLFEVQININESSMIASILNKYFIMPSLYIVWLLHIITFSDMHSNMNHLLFILGLYVYTFIIMLVFVGLTRVLMIRINKK